MRKILVALLFLTGTIPALAQVPEPTVLSNSAYSSSGATTSTASLSPAGDALIIVPTYKRWSVGTSAVTVSSEFAVTAAGWQRAVASTGYGSEVVEVEIWYAITTATPGSGTVTGTWANSFSQPKGLYVLQVASGFDTTTPIRTQTGDETGTASLAATTDLTGTLGSAPLSGSRLVQIMAGATNNAAATAISGFTILGAGAAGGNITDFAAHALGSNGASYGGQFNVEMTAGATAAAIEIQEPAGGGSTAVPVFTHHYRRMKR